jgi:hypothetical protein
MLPELWVLNTAGDGGNERLRVSVRLTPPYSSGRKKVGLAGRLHYGLQIADGRVVRGRIRWDASNDDQLPLLVTDGREIDWEQFGRMLTSHEGAQFKLTIADKSEEL